MLHPAPPGDADEPEPASRPGEASPSPSEPPLGDRQDFADFYRRHFQRLIVYLLYQGAPVHVAAELAQEAMTAAYKRWDKIRSPRSYIWKAAFRAYLHRLFDTEVPVPDVPEPLAGLPHPHDADEWLQKQHLLEVLRALPPRQRQVLALHLDGWADAEIADLLGISSAAVRSNLRKSRRNAAKHLHHLGGEDS